MINVSRETSRLPLKRIVPLVALVIVALALTACGSIAKPTGWAGPVYQNDTLYLRVKDNKLAAFNATVTEERWRFPRDGEKKIKLDGIYGEPLIVGDRVLVAGYNGDVYSLNASDGNLQWTATTGGAIVGGVAVAGDTVLVGSADNAVYAFALDNGSLRWRTKTGDHVWAKPVVVDETVYVASVDNKLYALNLKDGSFAWKEPFQAEAALPAAPAIAGDMVIVGSMDKRLYALNRNDGTVAWTFNADNWFWTTPLVSGDRVYAGNIDGRMYALQANDGKRIWEYEAGSQIRATPVIDNDILVVTDRDGFVHGIRTSDGSRVWISADLGTRLHANMLKRDSDVYILGENGALWSIQSANGAITQIKSKN